MTQKKLRALHMAYQCTYDAYREIERSRDPLKKDELDYIRERLETLQDIYLNDLKLDFTFTELTVKND